MLKNDARAALAIACAVGARFIRVNVHAGAVVADQGIVQSDAYGTLRDRRLLGSDVAIFADVGGKHATPLAPVDLEQPARDLMHRSLADGLVVSGPATGAATSLGDIKRVRGAVPHVPLLVGSGATAETAAELLSIADGLIVGTALKRERRRSPISLPSPPFAPVDRARVAAGRTLVTRRLATATLLGVAARLRLRRAARARLRAPHRARARPGLAPPRRLPGTEVGGNADLPSSSATRGSAGCCSSVAIVTATRWAGSPARRRRSRACTSRRCSSRWTPRAAA